MDQHIILGSRKLYSGNITVKSEKYYLGDKVVEKEIVQHPDSVGSLIEIPAGKIEKGETPEDAARREMNEEIGYCGKLTPLFQCYLAPGYDTEKMYFFLASNLKISKKRLTQDEDEEIKVKRIKLSSALEKCISGKIIDCKTIAAITMISNSKINW
jgi:ADP-ribose diphosphatase